LAHLDNSSSLSSDKTLRAGVLSVLLFGLAALAITDTVLSRNSFVSSWDSAIISTLYGMRLHWPWLTGLFFSVTHLGSDLIVFLLVIALAIWCARRGWRADAAWLVGTAIFARVSGWAAKLLLQSPRPHILDAPPVQEFSGYGFPSGHSLMSMAVYGAVALFILRHATTRAVRNATVLVCAVLIGAIGFSRIFLGAHWTNDVIGGFLYGACILTIAELLRTKYGKQNQGRPTR